MRIVCWLTILMKYHTYFFWKLIERLQNLPSAAVMIGALRVKSPLYEVKGWIETYNQVMTAQQISVVRQTQNWMASLSVCCETNCCADVQAGLCHLYTVNTYIWQVLLFGTLLAVKTKIAKIWDGEISFQFQLHIQYAINGLTSSVKWKSICQNRGNQS